MKTKVQLKKVYGAGTFSRVKHARYLGWEDAFDVEFEDGLCFLEPHAAIRRANRISAGALPVSVEVDGELGSHFTVCYDTGEKAEVSWSFVRELPPSHGPRAAGQEPVTHARVAERPVRYGKVPGAGSRRRST